MADFVARYPFPVLYPEGLTRQAQIMIGLVVVAVNLSLYMFLYAGKRRPTIGAQVSRSALDRKETEP